MSNYIDLYYLYDNIINNSSNLINTNNIINIVNINNNNSILKNIYYINNEFYNTYFDIIITYFIIN